MGIKVFELDDVYDMPERRKPDGGWKKPCNVADHKWGLFIEEGQAILECLDPHPESFAAECDPQCGIPVCADQYWLREDVHMNRHIPVAVEHIDDSTPSTPNGPAEYSFYIQISPLPDESERG
jgi:hypothetical protein